MNIVVGDRTMGKKIAFEGIYLMKMAAEMFDRNCQMNHQNKVGAVERILPKTEIVGSCHGSCQNEMMYAANCFRWANANQVPSGTVVTSPVSRGNLH